MTWSSALDIALSILPAEGWLLLAAGLVVGVVVTRWVRNLRNRLRMWWKRRLGTRGETRAAKLLRKAGYQVLDEQVEREGTVLLDGTAHPFKIRADVLVERDGKRLVAEVKGGAEAARISNRNTRRQLLEYACHYDVDGVLLVDAHSGTIHRVECPALDQR